MTRESYDYAIAGAGSAGCVLAARLCEEEDATVCLVEAGGFGKSIWTRMPIGNGFLFGKKRYDWGLTSMPQPALMGRTIVLPRGRGVGGSSLINGMIYMRGCAGDYDRWSALGLPGWSYAELLPYFRKSATAAHRPGSEYHGDGPVQLSPAGNFDTVNQAFVDAAIQAGNPANEDFNGASQLGVGRLDVTVWNGRRQSAAVAYLKRKPDNLAIKTETHVLGIEFEGRRAVGLRLSSGFVEAKRETILCLGAFASPQLLMLSGIGPPEHLADHGIPVTHELPGVGSTLYDHPQLPMKFSLKDSRLSLARLQRIDRAFIVGLRCLLLSSGPGAAPFWSSVAFHALRNEDLPELQIYMTPMCISDEYGKRNWSFGSILNAGSLFMSRGPTAVPGLHFDVNLQRPRSHGSVRLASADPYDSPCIDLNWFTDSDDMAKMVAGMHHVREIVRQPALAEICGEELQPGSDAQTDAELERAVRSFVSTGHHPVSTCRMGAPDDDLAVVDDRLRVRGLERLRVVDASVFPDQIGGNTNAAAMMIAERAADLIRGIPPPPPACPEME